MEAFYRSAVYRPSCELLVMRTSVFREMPITPPRTSKLPRGVTKIDRMLALTSELQDGASIQEKTS